MSSRLVLTHGKKQWASALLQERCLAEAKKIYKDVCRADPRDTQVRIARKPVDNDQGSGRERNTGP